MSQPVWQFEHSVEVRASCAHAWAFWTVVSNWALVEGDAVEWIKLEGPFAPGARGATKVPGQEPRHWVISNVEAGKAATIQVQIN